jgi:hypothetical protein
MAVRKKELLVSCCGISHGEDFLISFYFINTWMQKHIYTHVQWRTEGWGSGVLTPPPLPPEIPKF